MYRVWVKCEWLTGLCRGTGAVKIAYRVLAYCKWLFAA